MTRRACAPRWLGRHVLTGPKPSNLVCAALLAWMAWTSAARVTQLLPQRHPDQTTLKIYAHVIPQSQRDAMESLSYVLRFE